MKGLLAIILCFVFNIAIASPVYTPETPVHVKGYYKKSGTYVQPYYRARPGQRQESSSSSSMGANLNSSNSYAMNSYPDQTYKSPSSQLNNNNQLNSDSETLNETQNNNLNGQSSNQESLSNDVPNFN